MFGPAMILTAYLLPAAITAAGAGLGQSRWAEGGWFGRVVRAVAVGLATVAGLVAIAGWPKVPAPEAWLWTVPFAGLAAVVGAGEAVGRAPGPWRWGVRLLLIQGLVGLILRPMVPDTLTIDGAALRWLGIVPAVLLIWGNLEALADRLDGRAWTTGLLVLTAGIAVALVLSRSLVLGQLGLVLVAVFTAASLVSWLWPRGPMGRGLSAPPVTVATGLLLSGSFYAELPLASLIALAIAPLTLWAGGLVRRGGWRQAVACALAVAVPTAIALGLCLRASLADDNPYS